MTTRPARNEPAPVAGVLVDADWLDAHLHDPAYLLGRDRVRVYDGSWAEWGQMPGAPVEQA
jgi:3-mercaptopyruvate sulfurtransferase SseA